MPRDDGAALAAALDVKNLAECIIKLSKGMEQMLAERPGGLKLDTIVLLLHEKTGIGKKTIQKLLQALPQLHAHFCVLK